jgi:phosphoglycolate phosphatase
MLKTIIFDFDGVINDSFQCFFPLIREGMAYIGKSLSEDQYRSFFRDNVHKAFKEFIDDEGKYKKFMEFRKNNFAKYYRPKLFPGIPDLLQKLKNKYKLAIASSGNKNSILKILENQKIDMLFQIVLATTEPTKENVIKEILRETNSSPEEAVIISDTTGDMSMAKRIGLKTIGVTWGFHSASTLNAAHPDFIVNSLQELKSLITKNGNN